MKAEIETPPRRRPVQVRAQVRVAKILDTAAEVFSEVGYEAATTNLIAARAEVPIGSLYQFFPNKAAIVTALGERYRRDVHSHFAQVFAALATGQVANRQVTDWVIDGLAVLQESQPGFKSLFLDTQVALLIDADALHREIIGWIERFFALRFPTLSEQRRHLHAVVCVTLVKALLGQAARLEGEDRQQMIIEAKAVLENYVERVERGAMSISP